MRKSIHVREEAHAHAKALSEVLNLSIEDVVSIAIVTLSEDLVKTAREEPDFEAIRPVNKTKPRTRTFRVKK